MNARYLRQGVGLVFASSSHPNETLFLHRTSLVSRVAIARVKFFVLRHQTCFLD